MKAFKPFLIIALVFILANSAFASPVWVEVTDSDDNPPEATLKTNKTDSVVFSVFSASLRCIFRR